LYRRIFSILQIFCFFSVFNISANAQTQPKNREFVSVGLASPAVNIGGSFEELLSLGMQSYSRLLQALTGTWFSRKSAINPEAGIVEDLQDDSPAFDIEELIKTEPTTYSAGNIEEYPFTTREYIEYFTSGKGRRTLEIGFMRAGKYRRLVEDIFRKEGVPTDLIWLAQVESVWVSKASSPASARGIWQFIPETGKRFGLRQDGWIDERLNIEKSTAAAARYLSKLNDRYEGDWLLAMAAYNYGEGAVDRAIRNSGSANFWSIRERGFLPEETARSEETARYVPSILAVSAIAKQPEVYGISVQPEADLQFDYMDVNRSARLSDIAALYNIPVEMLSALNPELIAGMVPPDGYELRVPKGVDLKASLR
jgi:hypothetical protein